MCRECGARAGRQSSAFWPCSLPRPRRAEVDPWPPRARHSLPHATPPRVFHRAPGRAAHPIEACPSLGPEPADHPSPGVVVSCVRRDADVRVLGVFCCCARARGRGASTHDQPIGRAHRALLFNSAESDRARCLRCSTPDLPRASALRRTCRSATALPHTLPTQLCVQPGRWGSVAGATRSRTHMHTRTRRGLHVNTKMMAVHWVSGLLQYIAIASGGLMLELQGVVETPPSGNVHPMCMHEPRGPTSVRDRVLVPLLALDLPGDVLELSRR